MSYRIERKLVAANTPVAPPECPAHSHVSSVLPPPPTVSSSRTCIEREPQIALAKASPSDDSSSNEGSDSSVERIDHHQNKSGLEFITTSDGD